VQQFDIWKALIYRDFYDGAKDKQTWLTDLDGKRGLTHKELFRVLCEFGLVNLHSENTKVSFCSGSKEECARMLDRSFGWTVGSQ